MNGGFAEENSERLGAFPARLKLTLMWGRNGFDGIVTLREVVSGSELP